MRFLGGFAPIALALTPLGITTPAQAADSSTLGSVEFFGTTASVGVYADISGDDDGDATAWVEYRVAGSGSYVRGHDLMRIAAGRWAGAVFFLEASKSYDVRVVLDDPDNSGQLTSDQTTSTRADAPATSTSDLWVDAATGKDSNPGTQAAPFATIQAAADKAKPGDKVRVKPGVYRESVTPPTAGTEVAPIWFVAEGAGVAVDGSDPALEKPTWQSEGGGVYSTAFSGQSEYVAADDARLYDYQSLSDLQNAAAGLPGGGSNASGGGGDDDGGCGCRVPAGSGSPALGFVSALLLFGVARRRRHRHR